MKPARVQLSRRKGWRMPPNTVKVDRSTKWGNPFVKHGDGRPYDRALSVLSFKEFIRKEGCWSPIPLPWPKGKIPREWTTIEDVKRELAGKNLACWCALDQPCHADVLLELANK